MRKILGFSMNIIYFFRCVPLVDHNINIHLIVDNIISTVILGFSRFIGPRILSFVYT